MVMENKKIDKSLKRAFKLLDRAATLAEDHRDTDALIAIADRWTLIADRLMNEDSQQQFSIGFIDQENDGRVDEPGRKKAGHKRKS